MSGGVFVDRTHMRDRITASLETEPTDPVAPCPDCGAETKPYGEAPREEAVEHICSNRLCREVQPRPDFVERYSVQDERPRYPCRKCARETKPTKRGRTGVTTKRICVRPDCRKIIETAS